MRNFPTHFWTRFTVEFKERDAFQSVDLSGKHPQVASTTYWEWTRRVQRLAVGLIDADFESGTRVGIVSRNCQEWVDLAFAVLLAGGCVVPLPADRDRRETLRCLARSGADWIVAYDETSLGELKGQGANLPEHLVWVSLKDLKANRQDKTLDLKTLHERGRYRTQRGALDELAKRTYHLSPDAPALILFPFEHTDDPHGATFSGGKLAVMLEYLGGDLHLEDGDVFAVLIGFSWFYGILLLMAAMLQGRTLAMSDGLGQLESDLPIFQPSVLASGPATIEGQLKTWQEHLEKAPNFLKDEQPFGFARALATIGDRAARKVLYEPVRAYFGGKLKRIVLATGKNFRPLPEEVLDILEQSEIKVCGMFGIAETGITHIERPEARRRHSVGRPVQGYVCKIDGAKDDEVGPVFVKSDVAFVGYWDKKGPLEPDEFGFLDTGAQGKITNGYLFLQPSETP